MKLKNHIHLSNLGSKNGLLAHQNYPLAKTHQNQEQNLGFKNGFLVNFKNSRTKNNSTNIHLPRLTVQISIEQRFKSTTVNQASSNGGYAILGVLAESEQCPICQSYNSNPP